MLGQPFWLSWCQLWLFALEKKIGLARLGFWPCEPHWQSYMRLSPDFREEVRDKLYFRLDQSPDKLEL